MNCDFFVFRICCSTMLTASCPNQHRQDPVGPAKAGPSGRDISDSKKKDKEKDKEKKAQEKKEKKEQKDQEKNAKKEREKQEKYDAKRLETQSKRAYETSTKTQPRKLISAFEYFQRLFPIYFHPIIF